MSELNVLDAIQLIRQQYLIAQLPIIALAALAMDKDHQRCLDADATLY